MHQSTWEDRAISPKTKNTQELAGPGKIVARVVLGIGVLAVVGVVITLLSIAAGNVSGGLRYVVGGLMGLLIAWFGIGYFRYMGNPPPPELEPMQVDPELRLSYLCEMCGLDLAVVAVAKERAPRHCGESMILVRRPQ